MTPDVRPGHPARTGDYRLKSWIEIRQPRTVGSANVLTTDNRTDYGQGEAVPFTVVARSRNADRLVSGTVRLVDGKRTLAKGKVEVRTNGPAASFVLSRRLTAALAPGDYALTVEAPGLTGVPAPLTIGPGREKTVFHTVQYGDYGAPIRTPTPGPHPTWHSLMRSERPGLASICSSTDSATPINRTPSARKGGERVSTH